MRRIAALTLALAPATLAQLTPDRTYYGVDRPMPFTVAIPAGVQGDPEVLLITPSTGEVVAQAPVTAGPLNLDKALPQLWDRAEHEVLYAQLAVDAKRIGPPVVLQPLVSPEYAVGTSSQGYPIFQKPPAPVFSGYRAYVDRHVVLTTTHGEMEFRMRPDEAPNTCWNFMHLVEGGYYTDVAFHRIIAGDPPFVIQVGDPTGSGGGGPGYMIDLENSKLPHDFGVISMARTNDPNTNGGQIFVCLSRKATQGLDNRYTAFGQCVRGADTIVKISRVPLSGERPVEPMPKILSARLIDAPPFGQAPNPVTPPDSE